MGGSSSHQKTPEDIVKVVVIGADSCFESMAKVGNKLDHRRRKVVFEDRVIQIHFHLISHANQIENLEQIHLRNLFEQSWGVVLNSHPSDPKTFWDRVTPLLSGFRLVVGKNEEAEEKGFQVVKTDSRIDSTFQNIILEILNQIGAALNVKGASRRGKSPESEEN